MRSTSATYASMRVSERDPSGKPCADCLERVPKDSWGYEKIYLHVDLENVAALRLYKSEGYVDVGSRWNPFWARQAAEIGYYETIIIICYR